MCTKCKHKLMVILKICINVMYVFIGILIAELIGYLPFIDMIFVKNTGTPLDSGLQVMSTMIIYCILIVWVRLLINNAKSYSVNLKSKTPRRCSIFNIFC